jgi:hypothetical protein
LDDLIQQYVIAEIERVSHSDIRELRKLLNRCDFSTVLKPRDYERIQEILKARNKWVHGGGITEMALAQYRGEIPKRQSISKTKFDADYRFIGGVCRRIDRRAMSNRVFLKGLAKAFPGIFFIE